MLSFISMVVAAAAGGQVTAGHSPHAEHMLQCAKVCADCQVICDACFKHCLTLLAEGGKEHVDTAQLCADCAECCKLAATLTARESPLAGPACECCATCCDKCAEACEKHPDDEEMAKCAKECRRCAETCRNMVKMVSAGA
jgi:hypothetical protein